MVAAGQPTAANFQLEVAGTTQEVTVTENSSEIQTQNAGVTTNYNAATIENMPNPGSDITYIAQTAPAWC